MQHISGEFWVAFLASKFSQVPPDAMLILLPWHVFIYKMIDGFAKKRRQSDDLYPLAYCGKYKSVFFGTVQ